MSGTPSLPTGTVLAGRFEIHSVLGRGGFSIAYLATDLTQQDECVVKELAPTGAQRKDKELDLSSVPGANPLRLRKRFLDEANLLGRLETPGVLSLRDAFEELGTAFYVTDTLPGARTLDSVLAQEGRLDSAQAQDILFQLLDILEAIHSHKILHRDLKPSNILLSPKGEVYVIDFGAAREWHANSAALQTVLFTPGYAPLEQLSDRGRRGPATDLYALCATAYHMLAGHPPRPAAERADGTEMVPLSRLRPDVDQPLVQAITAGLGLRFNERPQTIAELRMMLLVPENEEVSLSSLESYDAAAVRLKTFAYHRQECPVCSEPLERPKPLRPAVCPICRGSTIRPRHLPERLCAKCKTGVLQHKGGKTPIIFCPTCKCGLLAFRRKGLLFNRWAAECPECQAAFEGDAENAHKTSESPSEERSWQEWLAISNRTAEAWVCDVCATQFDVSNSGRWREIGKKGVSGSEYYPDEWARIAAGLKPDAGNAHCEACGADYWQDQESLTLLSAPVDPFKFAQRYLEQRLAIADLPWLGAGKTSGNRGLVCPHCDTEFDENGEFYTLVHSPSIRLSRNATRSLVMEDWHRLAQGLPMVSEEEQFDAKFSHALRLAFGAREIQFDSRNSELLWSGQAKEWSSDGTELGEGALTITTEEITYGRLLRKWRIPFAGILNITAEGPLLRLTISGEERARVFELEPAELMVHLNSGERSLWVDAELVAAVMKR